MRKRQVAHGLWKLTLFLYSMFAHFPLSKPGVEKVSEPILWYNLLCSPQYSNQPSTLWGKFFVPKASWCNIMCDNDKRAYFLYKGNGSWIFPSISRAPSVQIDSHMSSINLCFQKAGTDRTELINSFVVVCNGSQNKISLICFSFMYITNRGSTMAINLQWLMEYPVGED